MKREVFHYSSIVPGDPERPNVRIDTQEAGVFICLIDTGADKSIFPRFVGNMAGVDFSKAPDETAECAHGELIRCWKGELTVTFMEETFVMPMLFLSSDNTPALLGRAGFLDRYITTFDDKNKTFSFERN